MARLDDTVVKETRYIAVWTAILSGIMQAVFLIIGRWNLTVLLGNAFGGTIAVLNFLLMGVTVQRAIAQSRDDADFSMRFSQIMRNFMLLAAAVLALTLPIFNPAAAIIALFFPRIAIALIPFRDKNSHKKVVKTDENQKHKLSDS